MEMEKTGETNGRKDISLFTGGEETKIRKDKKNQPIKQNENIRLTG